MFLFNFAPRNPSRTCMEWIGNWYLICRTEEDRLRLARAAQVPTRSCHCAAEPLGIDLCLAAQ